MTLRHTLSALALLAAPAIAAQGTSDVFVGNQGQPASLTVVDADLEAAETLLSGQLGGFLQGMARINGNLYLTGNGTRIDVVDPATRARVAQITDAAFPTARYIAQASATKAYVTTQDYSGGTTSEVVVVDLASNTVSGRISVSTQPEGIAVAAGRAWLSTGAFDATTNLVAIDVATDAVVQTVDIGCSARLVLADAQDEVWAFCNGAAGTAEAVVLAGATGVEVARLTFDRALGSAFGLGQDAAVVENASSQEMLAIVEGGVVRVDTGANALGAFVALASGTASAVAGDAATGRIYAAYPDATGPFSANGTVVAYDADGLELGSFVAGVYPAYIVVDDATVVASDATPDAGTLALSAPVPNPTAGAARLTVTLAAVADLDAAVFDALGRRVATLAAGPLAAGEHVLTVDASALPAGVYVVRARTGAATASTRFSVTR